MVLKTLTRSRVYDKPVAAPRQNTQVTIMDAGLAGFSRFLDFVLGEEDLKTDPNADVGRALADTADCAPKFFPGFLSLQ